MLKAEMTRAAKSGTLKGLKRRAPRKSPSASARKALVIPHPGHGIPEIVLNGQMSGMYSKTLYGENPNERIARKSPNHRIRIKELKLSKGVG